MARINTYYSVRLADIAGADPIVRQGNERDTGTPEGTPDGHTPDTRHDTSVEPPEPAAREQPATFSGDISSTRTLKDWINDIHGRGGDALRGRPLADSPISHHNSWVRVPTPGTFDLPSGVRDGEGEYVSEVRMGNSDEGERPDVVQPTTDTPRSVFKGGGDDACETPLASATDNRPINTRAFIIRVDHLNTTVPFPKCDTPSGVYDGGGEPVRRPVMDTGDEKERPGVVQPTSDSPISVFDGGGDHIRERPSACVADNRTVRTCTVRLNDMGKINNLLKDRRDKSNVDKLKLCSAATQSEDSVANE